MNVKTAENIHLENFLIDTAKKLKQDVLDLAEIKENKNSTRDFADIPHNNKTKPVIYIGTLNRTDNAITGAIAHEIAHIILQEFDLHKKLYFVLLKKLTKSNQIAFKYSYYLALLTGYVYKHETKADRLGLELLNSAGLKVECMIEMVQGLKSKGLLQYILKKRRLRAIKRFIRNNIKIQFERKNRLEKIFNEAVEKATVDNSLEIWENTIRLMIETDRKDLLNKWNKLNSFAKILITAGEWFSYSEFKSHILDKESG